MKRLLTLAAGALLTLPAFAQSAIDYCAKARDPARCEARQAALKNCGEKRGAEKRACLEASIPPVDCSKAQTRKTVKPHKRPRKCAKEKPARN